MRKQPVFQIPVAVTLPNGGYDIILVSKNRWREMEEAKNDTEQKAVNGTA